MTIFGWFILYCNYLLCLFRLLSALQVLANNIPVQDNETVVVAKKNIAMGIKVINTKKTAGLLIQAASTTQPSVNNLTLTNSPSDVTTSKDMATIFLSGSLLDRAEKSGDITQRITTFIYDNEKLFLIRLEIDESRWNGTQISKKLNSKILSAAIKDTKLRNLKGEEQVRSTFSALDTDKGKTECVFWDFNGAGM